MSKIYPKLLYFSFIYTALEAFWQFSLADDASLRKVMWLGAFNLALLLLFPAICAMAGVGTDHTAHPTLAPTAAMARPLGGTWNQNQCQNIYSPQEFSLKSDRNEQCQVPISQLNAECMLRVAPGLI